MTALTHVLLTSFNPAVPGSAKNLDPAWLAHRLDLFTRWCAPSVRAQLNQNFHWLVLLDRRTPAAARAAVELLLPTNGTVLLLDRPLDDTPLTPALVGAGVPDTSVLLTSRLDGDGALGRGYTRRMREAAEDELAAGPLPESVAFNQPLGLRSTEGRLYGRLDRDNPFMSLLEPPAEARERRRDWRTVLAVPHRQLSALAPIRQLPAGPQWLQVVHGSHPDPAVRGVRIPRAAVRRGFGDLLPPTPACTS